MSTEKRASFATEDMAEGGSGLFDNVRATIVGGKFTKEPPNENYTPDGNPIFAVVDFILAGDAPIEERKVNQSYSLGAQAGDNFNISTDGDFLIPISDESKIVKGSKWGIFCRRLEAEGIPKTYLASFAFSDIKGLIDGQFKRLADEDRGFEPKKDQKGKNRPQTTLCLVKLFSEVKDGKLVPGKAAAASAPASASTGSPTTGSTAGSAATGGASSGDLDSDTLPYLEAALKANSGTLQRGRLTLAVSKQAADNPNRSVYGKHAGDEEYIKRLAEAGIVKYDAAGKGQPVSLA